MSSDSLWQKHWKGEVRGKAKKQKGWRKRLTDCELTHLNRSIGLCAEASDTNSIALHNQIERELIVLVCTMVKLLDEYEIK